MLREICGVEVQNAKLSWRFWGMCVQMGRKMWFLSALFGICFFILLNFWSSNLFYAACSAICHPYSFNYSKIEAY